MIEPQFWFYLLPLVWILLLIELYEPHVAGSGRKNDTGDRAGGIYWAGSILPGLYHKRGYQSSACVGVGAFLLFASILTLAWRVVFSAAFTNRRVNGGVSS